MAPTWRARLHPRYLPSAVLLVVETALFLAAVTKGLDYYHGVSAELAILPVITALASAHTWGVIYLIGSAVLGAGLLMWRHFITWFGHVYLAAAHAGFLAGACEVALPAHAWRIPAALLLPTVMHVLLAWHLGPIPPRRR